MKRETTKFVSTLKLKQNSLNTEITKAEIVAKKSTWKNRENEKTRQKKTGRFVLFVLSVFVDAIYAFTSFVLLIKMTRVANNL